MAGAEPQRFSERDFYLSEFRGRTLAVAVPEAASAGRAALVRTAAALTEAGVRLVVLAERPRGLERELGCELLPASRPHLEAEVWRSLRERRVAAVAAGPAAPAAPGGAFAPACRALALRLGVFKLVWLDPGGGLRRRSGRRESFMHLEELRRLLAEPGSLDPAREPLWREVAALLEAGLPAVNVCSAEGLDDELFTYAGSGTLFTRERYMTVRPLGVDDFDTATDLIRRGVAEGYLAPRRGEALDAVLAEGFGAFVESRHLAGIGALLPGGDGRSGEIASLYTVTRFLGEGVGGALVAHALATARARGLAYVYACTTHARVGEFFLRQGLRAVPRDALPAAKWVGYDPERLARVRCFRRDLADLEAEAAASPLAGEVVAGEGVAGEGGEGGAGGGL